MSSNLEDSFFDFDISLLQENPNSTELENKIEKQRKSILLLKKKTIHTDTAVKKILSTNQKLEELEKKLSASSETNKQICINYNNALDKAMKLEKSVDFYRRRLGELQEKLEVSETQCKASQSHANQLQQLVQDCETQIESFKIENKIVKLNTKEQTKETHSQKSEPNCFVQDLCSLTDFVLGKKKLRNKHVKILKKYENFKLNTDTDGSASDCSIDDIDDIFNDCIPSLIFTRGLLPKNRMLQDSQSFTARELEKNLQNDDLSNKTRDANHDSDSNNEGEDTGRGSSLASSDIEKCFNSPDYFITNSPFSNGMIKDKKNYADISTSPITVQRERSDACTSPLLFSNKIIGANIGYIKKQTKDIGIQVHINNLIAYRNVATSPIKIRVQERATSPIKIIAQERATSPIKIIAQERATSPIKIIAQERATSPINIIAQERATSPIQIIAQERATSPFKIITLDRKRLSFMDKTTVENASSPILKNLQDKTTISMKHQQKEKSTSPFEFGNNNSNTQTCANKQESPEINNCKVYDDNQDSDREVENILRSMRLDYNLMTPIPKSPAKQDNSQPFDGYYQSDFQKLSQEVKMLKAELYGFREDIYAKVPFLNNDKVHHTTNNCKENDMLINNHENVLAKPRENCETVESPLKNSSMKLNIISSPKAPAFKVFSKIDEVQKENQINNNKSENRIISQEYAIKTPIKVIDKIKKTKKLTRLEKFRKKLLPRGKIRRALTPPRKISLKNPLLFKKRLLEHSIPAQNNIMAYETAVKLIAERRDKMKNKSVNPIQCKDAVNNMITQEVHIVLSKCDEPVAQNKLIVSTAGSNKTPAFIKSSLKSNAAVNNVSNFQNNTAKMSVNKAPTNIDDFSTPLLLRRSKRLSSSASNNSDISIRTTLETEDEFTNEVQFSKRLKSVESEMSEGPCKKSLSSIENDTDSVNNRTSKPIEYRRRSARLSTTQKNDSKIEKDLTNHNSANVVIYNDLDMFSEQVPQPQVCQNNSSEDISCLMDNILIKTVIKHAKSKNKWNMKKPPEKVVTSTCKNLEDVIAKIQLSPNNVKETMNNYVQDLRRCNIKIFLAGLKKYLMDPARKCEMFNKTSILHSPPMTKSERVLIYILLQLRYFWRDVDLFQNVIAVIETTLLKLNHTPTFGVVESMSHFYAVLCRFLGMLSHLRMFIIDAMYCIQFKCIAIIKQATDVWMHILPLAHMGMAKSPIVNCLVYLLHFFKCEDKYNRVQEIRTILSRKYFYKIYEWSESDILEMLLNAVKDLSDNKLENNMLRMALIIFAKRKGPQWCQKYVVHNMLLPLIRNHDVPDKIKEFCLSVLGRVLKPYPSVMKFQSESVFNELLLMLEKGVTPTMKEAILSCLLYMRYNRDRVHHILFKWNPVSISPEFEVLLANYIKEKPVHVWTTLLEKIACDTNKYDDFVNL